MFVEVPSGEQQQHLSLLESGPDFRQTAVGHCMRPADWGAPNHEPAPADSAAVSWVVCDGIGDSLGSSGAPPALPPKRKDSCLASTPAVSPLALSPTRPSAIAIVPDGPHIPDKKSRSACVRSHSDSSGHINPEAMSRLLQTSFIMQQVATAAGTHHHATTAGAAVVTSQPLKRAATVAAYREVPPAARARSPQVADSTAKPAPGISCTSLLPVLSKPLSGTAKPPPPAPPPRPSTLAMRPHNLAEFSQRNA